MGFKLAIIFFALLIASSIQRASAQSFKAQQLKYSRVKNALAEKEALIKEMFRRKKLPYPPTKIFIRIFKRERIVEVWAGRSRESQLEMLKAYNFCATSGSLGPKRRMGDGQIPEGFYYIDRFNPVSNFHLSLGVNYPNQSDRTLGVKGRLGGDIFIHGDCVTIGCVPITDDGIKELYLIAVEARSSGRSRIPVHIFPSRFDRNGMKQLESYSLNNETLRNFWMNLKEGYDFFERHRRLPTITVDQRGRYIVRG
ncbi:MAG: hypothetical protein L0229_20010 [Blastocatellia bacterium]|nr:hypothetical protein [Blastocatellia bacterium]